MNHTKSKLSGMISKGFKAEKCKVSLRMAMSRMKLLRNKREVQVRQMKRDVAQLLQSGQNQTARIRVEHVIREEKTMAAYELLELYCELIVARLTIIDSQKTCPIDLREAISSVIFATPRCADVLELTDVQKQFVAKYGKEFASAALELRPDCGVSHMVVEKLSAKAPDMETKIKTLKSIAEEHGVEWDPKALLDELQKQKNDLLGGSGSQVRLDHPAASDLHSSTQPKPTQFLSASQVAMGYSAIDSSTGSAQTPFQSKPTPFLSASQIATGYSDNDSSTGSVQTSSQSKPAQFFSASEVMMGHSDTSSSTGQSSFAQKKDGGTSEGDVAKPPDDQVSPHGGIISSTGSIIYPPPPPPFMKFEESAPSRTQPEFASPDGSPRQEITEQKYKDAKEAAREAAKSAERAQMAARAAAELARQEKRARGKDQVEEDTYNMPRVGSVEGGHKQSETQNLDMHNHQVVQDSESNGEEEEEEITINATGPDRGNEYDVYWDKHEPSSVAVFDQSDSDMDDHSPNLLDTLSHSLQPKKEEYASDFYWREKVDNKKPDRSSSVFLEESTNDSSPPPFVNNSAPTFDSDGISSGDENKGGIKASKEQPKFIHSEEREEETEFPVGMKNTRVSSDDDNDKPKIDLNFERLTGGFKNKGYRRTPYVNKPIINVTPSAETLDNHEVHVSPRTKNTPTSDLNETKASSVLSVETGKGRRGSKNLASRFDTNYFDTEDEVEEPENQQVQDTSRLVNRNIIKHSRRTRGTPTSETRKKDNINFGENRQLESSDEEKVKESEVTEKAGLEEDESKSSASPSSVRYRRPPDYDSLAAHFRSLRTNRS